MQTMIKARMTEFGGKTHEAIYRSLCIGRQGI